MWALTGSVSSGAGAVGAGLGVDLHSNAITKTPGINQAIPAPKVKETYYGEGLAHKRDVRFVKESF